MCDCKKGNLHGEVVKKFQQKRGFGKNIQGKNELIY